MSDSAGRGENPQTWDRLATLAAARGFDLLVDRRNTGPAIIALQLLLDAFSRPASVSQAEAEAGTETALRSWSPRRVAQAIEALADSADLPDPVTQAEAEAGTVTGNRLWSPRRVAQAIAALATSSGGTGLTPAQARALGRLIILSADLEEVRDASWVAATSGPEFVALGTSDANVARLTNGQAPQGTLSWIRSHAGYADERVIVVRVANDTRLADYRLVIGDESERLDFLPTVASGGGYSYLSLLLAASANSALTIQHHGGVSHLRFLGDLVGAKIIEALTALTGQDRLPQTAVQFERVEVAAAATGMSFVIAGQGSGAATVDDAGNEGGVLVGSGWQTDYRHLHGRWYVISSAGSGDFIVNLADLLFIDSQGHRALFEDNVHICYIQNNRPAGDITFAGGGRADIYPTTAQGGARVKPGYSAIVTLSAHATNRYILAVNAWNPRSAVGGSDSSSSVAYHGVTHEGTTGLDPVETEADVDVVDLWYIVAATGLTGALAGNANRLVRKTTGGSFTFRDPVPFLPYFLTADTTDPDDDEPFLGLVMWNGTAWKRMAFGHNNTRHWLAFTSGEGNSALEANSMAVGARNAITARQGIALGSDNSLSGGIGAIAIGERNRANGALSLAIGKNLVVSVARAMILGENGVVGDPNTRLGIAEGAGIPSDAIQSAAADWGLMAKWTRDGKFIAKRLFKSSDPDTSEGDEIPATDAEVKTAYERNADTNAFTDADEAKLDSLGAGAIDMSLHPVGVESAAHIRREFVIQMGAQVGGAIQDRVDIWMGHRRILTQNNTSDRDQLFRVTPTQPDQDNMVTNYGSATSIPVSLNFYKNGAAVGQRVAKDLLLGSEFAEPEELHVETPYARTLYDYTSGGGTEPAFATAIYAVVEGGYQLSSWESHWEERPRLTGSLRWIARVDRDPVTGLPVAAISRAITGWNYRYYASEDADSDNSDVYDADVHNYYRLMNADYTWGPFIPIEEDAGLTSHAWTQIFSHQGTYHHGNVVDRLGLTQLSTTRWQEFCFEVSNANADGTSHGRRYRTEALGMEMITGLAAHNATTGGIGNQMRVSAGGAARASALAMVADQGVAAEWDADDGAEFVVVLRRSSTDTYVHSRALDSAYIAARAGTGTGHLTVRMLAR